MDCSPFWGNDVVEGSHDVSRLGCLSVVCSAWEPVFSEASSESGQGDRLGGFSPRYGVWLFFGGTIGFWGSIFVLAVGVLRIVGLMVGLVLRFCFRGLLVFSSPFSFVEDFCDSAG